tara:strand:+ start:300 stop:455 length:156 start_codon:yes stop_codon:yes gene_type:complete
MSCSAKFLLIIDKLNNKNLERKNLESNKLNKIVKINKDNFNKYIFKMDLGD